MPSRLGQLRRTVGVMGDWPGDDLLEEFDTAARGSGAHTVESDSAQHAPPRPVDRFRSTAVGTVVAAGLLGLRDALEGRPEREEIAIVSEAPERPVDRSGPQVVFDPDDPTRVTVIVPPVHGG
jgi:hypothetical protein